MKRVQPGLVLWLLIIGTAPTAVAQLAPDEELKTIQVEAPLRVELVAAEPQVESPCAMAFDEQGRIFVAENRGYPHTIEPPQGRVVMLESTRHDGHFDKSTVIADDLTFPNGVMPWEGGLIATCAPDVLFFDRVAMAGLADPRRNAGAAPIKPRVLLTGFDASKSTQLRVNHPMLGPDGWIYFAAGLVGGTITSPEHPEKPAVKMTGDLRWNPRTGDFENVDGRSQFGMSFDELGRRFICMNRLPVQHVVLQSRWLRRNPHLAFSETVQDCSERTVKSGLRGGGDGVRVYPISHNITTADSHAGSFTAACGVLIWSGGTLPEPFDGCALSCEPTGNLVHADRLRADGATFHAESLLKERELFASSDDWCRPVFLTSGPDGALYVCDMYRKIIEHPDYLPEELRKHSDFDAGKTMGRIWRVTGGTKNRTPSVPAEERRLELDDELAALPLEALLHAADSADMRVRFRASLGLGESHEPRAVSALVKIALAGADDRWTRAGVFSSIAGRERDFASELFAKLNAEAPGALDLAGELGLIFGRAAVAEKHDAFSDESLPKMDGVSAALRLAFLGGVADGANARVTESAPEWVRAAIADSAKIAQQREASIETRTRALGILKHADWNTAGPALTAVATRDASFELRTAAIRALATFEGPEVADALLSHAHWNAIAPAEREVTLSALLARPAHVPRVLDAIEAGSLPRNALSAAQKNALFKTKDIALRDRATKLLGAPADSDRMKAYEAAKSVLALTPGAEHGREVFKTICSSCHRLDREGHQVGPDLLDIRSQPKESILLHIVVPDYEIAPGFAATIVELKDGRALAGIVISDTPESITVREPLGVEENVLRSNVAQLSASEHSLMPPGLEAAMSKQDLADLLAFLKGEK